MEANLLGHDEEDCGFEVFDERGNRHVISVTWDGSIGQHATPDYPNSPEDRTQDEQRIMTEVEHRARYEAQLEFPDADILPVSGMPQVIERGMAAVQQMPTDEFAEVFRDYYEAVVDTAQALPSDVPADRARMVNFAFTITNDDQFGRPGHVNVFYINDADEIDATDPNTFPDSTNYVKLHFPADSDFGSDFEYPEDFFAVVQTNLVYQIRDRYLQMGEEPPENYQVDGPHIFSLVGTDEEALFDHVHA